MKYFDEVVCRICKYRVYMSCLVLEDWGYECVICINEDGFLGCGLENVKNGVFLLIIMIWIYACGNCFFFWVVYVVKEELYVFMFFMLGYNYLLIKLNFDLFEFCYYIFFIGVILVCCYFVVIIYVVIMFYFIDL